MGPYLMGTSPKDAWYCPGISRSICQVIFNTEIYYQGIFVLWANEQLDILEKAFHPISALNTVRTGWETVNLEKGKSLQDIEVDPF